MFADTSTSYLMQKHEITPLQGDDPRRYYENWEVCNNAQAIFDGSLAG